jgi:hypothetical protein
VNPLWVPIWKPVEPWQFKPADRRRCESKLLGSISGHNLCLSWFGEPSAEEVKAGMEGHGEASVVKWQLAARYCRKGEVSMTCAGELPAARMKVSRTLSARQGESLVRVHEVVRNLAPVDSPFTMCQHVTFGPPFLEKDVTVFDMPALKSNTFPGKFGDPQRLASDRAFTWPRCPGADGRVVDLRTIGSEWKASSDFSAQLIDQKLEDAWFAAVNPRLGLLTAYVWRRRDYPWVGNWEENYGRKNLPWAGKSLTRGMEFTNSPFAVGLRRAVDMGRFNGVATYRWLPAMGQLTFDYEIIMRRIAPTVKGVAEIQRQGRDFRVLFAR